MHLKIALSLVAYVIAFASYAPYIKDLHAGKTKPHAYSWFIWALLAYMAGIAQLSDGGGGGAWVTIISATICLYISIVAFKRASLQFTKSDKASLLLALLAIPIWVVTKDPLSAILLVTSIDLVGFWPTIRKSYSAPHQETMSTYWLAIAKNCFAIAALQHYNLVTVVYPASIVLADGLCVVLFLTRQRILAVSKQT